MHIKFAKLEAMGFSVDVSETGVIIYPKTQNPKVTSIFHKLVDAMGLSDQECDEANCALTRIQIVSALKRM